MVDSLWYEHNKPYVWLPYARSCADPLLFRVRRAQGCTLIMDDGSEVLDGISGWWSMCHGYSHPYINEKMREQIDLSSHLSLSGCANEQTYRLAGRLVQSVGPWAEKVLFVESGSSATDASLKIALQYNSVLGKSQKRKFIYFKNGYHGETLASFGVSDVAWSGGGLGDNYCLPLPELDELDEFAKRVEVCADEVAAIIVEPLVQAAGGMKFYSEEVLRGIYEIAKRYSLLFIVDEIAVGFYRLGGAMFAFQRASIEPDMVLLGKALSGGHCPGCGAVIISRDIANAFVDAPLSHGTTFMGNALLCAAANASLDIFANYDVSASVARIENILSEGLEALKGVDGVTDVRVRGALGVVEFSGCVDVLCMREKMSKVWLRPFANVLYIMPPFIVSDTQLRLMIEAVYELARSVEWVDAEEAGEC